MLPGAFSAAVLVGAGCLGLGLTGVHAGAIGPAVGALFAGLGATPHSGGGRAPRPAAMPTGMATAVPAPSFTAAPLATPTVTTIPVGQALFLDNMTTNVNGWQTGLSSQYEVYFQGGACHFINTDPRMLLTVGLANPRTSYRDFALETDLSKVAGPDDAYYGVAFRVTGRTGGYAFVIS